MRTTLERHRKTIRIRNYIHDILVSIVVSYFKENKFKVAAYVYRGNTGRIIRFLQFKGEGMNLNEIAKEVMETIADAFVSNDDEPDADVSFVLKRGGEE